MYDDLLSAMDVFGDAADYGSSASDYVTAADSAGSLADLGSLDAFDPSVYDVGSNVGAFGSGDYYPSDWYTIPDGEVPVDFADAAAGDGLDLGGVAQQGTGTVSNLPETSILGNLGNFIKQYGSAGLGIITKLLGGNTTGGNGTTGTNTGTTIGVGGTTGVGGILGNLGNLLGMDSSTTQSILNGLGLGNDATGSLTNMGLNALLGSKALDAYKNSPTYQNVDPNLLNDPYYKGISDQVMQGVLRSANSRGVTNMTTAAKQAADAAMNKVWSPLASLQNTQNMAANNQRYQGWNTQATNTANFWGDIAKGVNNQSSLQQQYNMLDSLMGKYGGKPTGTTTTQTPYTNGVTLSDITSLFNNQQNNTATEQGGYDPNANQNQWSWY